MTLCRSTLFTCLLLLSPLAALAAEPLVKSSFTPGFNIEQVPTAATERPQQLDWWYPTSEQAASPINYGFGRGEVVEAGRIAAGRFPLVVLSHGAFGAARNYSWLAEYLAAEGYLVAGLAHFGESYIYGQQHVDPGAVLTPWNRLRDVTEVLDFISTRSQFRHAVDWQKLAFVGHSSGGATALLLAGADFSASRLGQYCASAASALDRGCDYARGQPNLRLPPSETKPLSKRKFGAFVAIDPALGPGLVSSNTANEKFNPLAAVLFVGSTNNDFLPFAHHAQRLQSATANSRHLWLTNGEGHFIYLDECSLELEANGIALCNDRAGVNRGEVHRKLQPEIRRFLDTQLRGGDSTMRRKGKLFQRYINAAVPANLFAQANNIAHD